MNKYLPHAVFAAGLASLAWVGAGYVGHHPLALCITLLIGAFYLMGALELHRYGQATDALAAAVRALPDPLPALQPWLDRLPAALQNPVRRRIEGEPAAIPGPALAPYLAGLLVLLGMLGTFVGMVFTLRGTGLALETSTDLQAVRNSLVAPVAGLGLAFGTSIAGVAASAALGLMSALRRRERLQAAQALDARIATTLRPHSAAHQREESLKLMQRQAELMPALVDSLQAVVKAMEQQSQAAHERLLAGQERFQDRTEASMLALAASVDRTLKESLSESARLAGATIGPAVESTLAGIARETAALHRGLSEGWRASLDGFAQAFEQRSSALVDTLSRRHAELQAGFGTQAAQAATATAAEVSQLVQAVQEAQAGQEAAAAARDQQRLEAMSKALDSLAGSLQRHWQEAGAQSLAQQQQVSATLERTAREITERAAAQASATTAEIAQLMQAAADGPRQAATAMTKAAERFDAHAASLLQAVQEAQAGQEAAAAARDQQRLEAMSKALDSLAGSLQRHWQEAGAQSLAQQQQVSATLERTAREITERAAEQASATTAEIARLMQAAAEGPRAAAEVIEALRGKLSDSMARDNALLEERARILETLGTLLDAVHASATEQRGAIDAMVRGSAELLDRVGSRFNEQVEAQAGRLEGVAAQVAGSAIEVASLGEAFGTAVQLFSESNGRLVAQMERIDDALGKSLARSDEQLAYYVAQAREVIDLSMLSQKQIIEDLKRLAGRPTPLAEATS